MRAKDLPVTTGGLTSNKIMKVNASGTLENITVANLVTLMNVATSTYTKYVALLDQTGTAAPVATVLENTLGITISWSRVGVGEYRGTPSSGTFIAGKTFVTGGTGWGSVSDVVQIGNNVTNILVNTNQQSASPTDDILVRIAIEIRVYP